MVITYAQNPQVWDSNTGNEVSQCVPQPVSHQPGTPWTKLVSKFELWVSSVVVHRLQKFHTSPTSIWPKQRMHRSRSHPNISIARKTLIHAFVRSPCRILVVIVVLCFLALSILQQTNEKMDIKSTYFISHGSPTLAIDKELPARHFLEDWQKKFMPSKPRAILIVSAHWDTKYPAVNTPSRHSTIHDFYGFPREMYQLRYDAPGAPELAKRVKELLISSGFKTVKEDPSRGLDHGAWVPLSLMYPEVDIPVCQLSVQSHQNAEYHLNMGKALAPLKSEGILIIGSGSATHNLGSLSHSYSSPIPWAQAFDNWLTESLTNNRYEEVINYEVNAPHAKKAHPYPEHFYPLHVALGAAGESAKAELVHTSWSLGTLSYSSYEFKSA